MNTQITLTQLRELGLLGMAESFESMMALPTQNRPGLDRAVQKMVETEICARNKKQTEKLLKAAKLRYTVFIEDITCSTERNLTEDQLAEIADCGFVRRGSNLLITGLTGCGKSYLACAIGRQACCLGLSTLFISMNHFTDELAKSRLDGTYGNLMKRLVKKDLIILDDFGLQPLTSDTRLALLTLLEDRYGDKSVIITSQLALEKWYDYIGEPTLADAIMDRLVHGSEHIALKGETMRQYRHYNKKK